MMGNEQNIKNNKQDYRNAVNSMGKKEFTLLKMQEFGFWPKDLPTPYEKQANETKEQYEERKKLIKSYEKVSAQIAELYKEKEEISAKLSELRKKYDETWDYEKIRADVAQTIMQESIARRTERKRLREEEKEKKSQEWIKYRSEKIVFIGKGYSSMLQDLVINEEKLKEHDLPIIKDDRELADFLGIEYKKLRLIAYHRDVIKIDNYYRFNIPKKKEGVRNIAAPKTLLKEVQRKILDEILVKIPVCKNAHGFLIGKGVVSGAKAHETMPELLINMDLENFFPTISFQRVRGMFKGFGYSGYIASILAMICTYCERIPIEVKGETRYVKVSERILPQGSPASPMISNIICRNLDKRLSGLAEKENFVYSRYADDMSFSFKMNSEDLDIGKLIGFISAIIKEEGFNINLKKTRYLRKNNRQSITGIILNNNEFGVSKKCVKILRASIYNAAKMKKEKGYVPEKTLYEIHGKVSWLRSINETKYAKIIEDARLLLDSK